MANIIYKQFLNGLVTDKIDICKKDTFKVALFKESYIPDENTIYNFNTYQLAGYEVEDSNKELFSDYPNKGYKEGGKFVQFEEMNFSVDTDIKKYSCGKIQWLHTTLNKDNAVKYVIIYRESDGLLVSCHDLTEPRIIDDDTLLLDWTGVSTLEISSETGGGIDIIDEGFSKTSHNALANNVITYGLERYGIVLEEDPVESPMDEMDRLVSIKDDYINSLFNK